MDSSLTSQDQSPAVHTLSVNRNLSSPHQPSNDDIEAVIQAAMSSRPSPARDTRTQLFVGNLPYRVRWQDLKDLFRRAGTVLRADVSLGADNRSRGYGTVLLATAEDAGRAIDMFNGYSWQTRILEVRHDRLPPSDFDAPVGPLSATSTGPGTMSRHHSALGAGQFPSIDEISDAHGLFNPYQSHDGSLGPSGTSSRNLFVGNLPFHCQWQDLKDLFRGSGGTILRADVALGPDGRSRGFGTVVFANDYDAENALRMFDGYEYNGRSLKVHFDKFSAVGHNSASGTPLAGVAPQIHLSHPHPRLPTSSFRLPISPLAQSIERAEPSPFDLYASEQQAFLSQQAHAQQRPSSLSPVPPRPAVLGIASRSGSSSTSSSSNPTAFDMESIATSLSSVSSYQGPSAPSGRLSSKPASHGSPVDKSAPTTERKSSKPQPHSPQRTHSHPHHPGTITLPPPAPLHPFPHSPTHSIGHVTPMHSPHHPLNHRQYPQFTPHGLPPMTPSMPAFYFPQPSPHGGAPIYYQAVHTPTGMAMAYSHHLASSSTAMATPPIPTFLPLQTPPIHMTAPGQMFSPMSPGSFWAGGTVNPAINPTVGAPVRNPEDGSGTDSARPPEATGYFDMPFYFPHVPNSGSSGAHDVGSPEDSQPLDDPRYPNVLHPESAIETPEETPNEAILPHPSRAQSMSQDARPVQPSMRKNDSDPSAPTLRSDAAIHHE